MNQEYVSNNFQTGPLGSLYPDIAYIMEGDSPSFMHTMMNGLNADPFDDPGWGGWGARYVLQDLTRQTMLYEDVRDKVTGVDGTWWTSNHASFWVWRQAYQDEMSARTQWSIRTSYNDGSHPPVVEVNRSCDSAPSVFEVEPEQTVVLDAGGGRMILIPTSRRITP